MSFISYSKIPLNSNEWNPAYKKIKLWYITEKIHGANLSFNYNVQNNILRYGKRNGLIEDNDVFFQYKNILPNTLPKILIIINYIKDNYPDVNDIIIFGELFGGSYPHSSVKINNSVKSIQKGIYYSPDLHFYAFDIMINNKYIDYNIALDIFEISKILYAKPLKICQSYEEAITYPIYFNTTIPSKFNLPEIPNNYAEGIVIKSNTDRYISKIKISKFSEKINNEKNENIESKSIKSIKRYKYYAKLELTEQRLNNASSKIGVFEENKEQIYNELVNDILTELDAFNVNGLSEWLLEQAKIKFEN